MKGSNIYIEVLKYGAENLNKGITYNEAISHLGKYAPVGDFELYFNNWFYDNFHSPNIPVLKKKHNENVILNKEDLLEANSEKVFLTSSAYFKLMSFSHDTASVETIVALVLSSVSLVTSLAIYLYILIKI